MKKIIYLLPILAVLFTGCSDKNTVIGKFSNADNDGKQIVLFESNGLNAPTAIDSTIVKNGSFSFNRKPTDNPTVAILQIQNAAPNSQNVIPYINENGSIEITIDSLTTIKGTPMNDAYQKFINEVVSVDKKIQSLSMEASSIQDQTLLEPYIKQFGDLQNQISQTAYDYIKSNITNKVGEASLLNYASLLSEAQFNELLALTSPDFQKEISPLLQQNQQEETAFVEKNYINVTGNTPDGKKISLSDYVGKNKVVLIDFWASWCGPCIKEMPHVVEAYDLFKDKGFEVVGISLDDEKSDWVEAIKKLNMTWPQMSDLKGWESELSAPYHVKSIPFTLLVDQNGKIIGENLRGTDLINKIEEVLK